MSLSKVSLNQVVQTYESSSVGALTGLMSRFHFGLIQISQTHNKSEEPALTEHLSVDS